MKFTKEILDYFEQNALFDDGYYLGNFEQYSERDLGKKITWSNMRARIEELEKIADNK